MRLSAERIEHVLRFRKLSGRRRATRDGMLVSLDCVEQAGQAPPGRWTIYLGDHVRGPSPRSNERVVERA